MLAALLPVHWLLHVFEGATGAELRAASRHAGQISLMLSAGIFVIWTLFAWAEDLRKVPRLSRRASRGIGVVVAVGVLALGVAGVLVTTHGDPVSFVKRQWHGFVHIDYAPSSTTHFFSVGSGRYDFWRVAVDAVKAHPVGGLGQDNFADYYITRRHTGEEPRWTHSLEFRLLAHTGIVGFVLFAVFLIAAVVAAAVAIRRGRARPLLAAAAAGGMLPLLPWLVHGSVDWFWEVPALSGPAFAFLGMAAGLGRRRDDTETTGLASDRRLPKRPAPRRRRRPTPPRHRHPDAAERPPPDAPPTPTRPPTPPTPTRRRRRRPTADADATADAGDATADADAPAATVPVPSAESSPTRIRHPTLTPCRPPIPCPSRPGNPSSQRARPRRTSLGVRILLGLTGVVALLAATAVLAFPYLSVRYTSIATHIRNRNPAAALSDLSKAADLNPLSPDPTRLAGIIALAGGRPQLAEQRFAETTSREPGGWFGWFGRGIAASALGNNVAAHRYLRVAAVLNSTAPVLADALFRVNTDHPMTPAEAFRKLARQT